MLIVVFFFLPSVEVDRPFKSCPSFQAIEKTGFNFKATKCIVLFFNLILLSSSLLTFMTYFYSIKLTNYVANFKCAALFW